MTLTFSARIEGPHIICEIGSDEALIAPVFCFSLLAAPRVVAGGTLLRRLASFAEVALPDIPALGRQRVVLAYQNADFLPRNRAWLPLGAYLRVGRQCLPLPASVPLGVQGEAPPRPAPALAPVSLPIVPPPQGWRPAGGEVAVSLLAGDDPALAGADALARRLGLAPLLGPGGTPLTVTRGGGLGDEAYVLTIAPEGITLFAATDHGLHNGAITLLSLRETTGGRLPCGVISDNPRFGWRGQHLDCARHFFAVGTILRLLDLMALLKLNRFHWHFADDEAFRLEVDCAPDLWRKTAFRGEGELVPGVFGGGIRAGGSYSPADVAQVLARAAELHIEVLPEIEVPAHSHAMVKAVPGLRDPGDNGEEVSIQGYIDNIVNPAMPATWNLLRPLMHEVAGLFPIGILHLGGDEAPHGAWEGSPAVAALRAREGLITPDDVQGWMMGELAGDLAAKGIRAAAWEEAAMGNRGGIGHGALLFSWTGQGPGLRAAQEGYDVVMCPAPNTYFDLAHSPDPDDWGAAWAGYLPLEKTVEWSPLPRIAQHLSERIVGVQSCFWGEFTTDDRQMEAMVAPRILGLACKAWERDGTTSGPQIRALADLYGPLFDRIGWARNKAA